MYLFVINAKSGNGGARRVWDKIRTVLHKRNIPYEYTCTQSAEEAQAYLKERLTERTDWLAGICHFSEALYRAGSDNYPFAKWRTGLQLYPAVAPKRRAGSCR